MTEDISTTMAVEDYTAVCLRVLKVAQAGREEMRQRAEAEARSKAEQEQQWLAKLDSAWSPLVAAAKDVLPEWMHEYLRWDNLTYPNSIDRWLELDLPECLPIDMWPDFNWPDPVKVLFVVPDVIPWQDDDNERQVAVDCDRRTAERYPTLEVAVAYAHDRYGQYLEACAEAERHNAEMHAADASKVAAEPAPVAPKPAQIEIPHDPAAKVLSAIAELDLDLDTVFERGLLYGLITIALELRAICGGIDDIAAVVVANDPKANEENQK